MIIFIFIKVVDPSTGELITVDAAINKGIFDPAKGKYFNVKTGELLSIQEAVSRNLMVTSAKVIILIECFLCFYFCISHIF